MAKTLEELNAIKEEVETLNNKLNELTEDELEQVTGGGYRPQFYFRTTDIIGGIALGCINNNEEVYSKEYRQECPSCHGTSVNYKLDLGTFNYNCHCNGCGKDYVSK